MQPDIQPEILRQEIHQLIETKDVRKLRDVLVTLLPADIAEIIKELEEHERGVVFRILPKELATQTFEFVDPEDQRTLLSSLGDKRFAILFNEMSADDRTALLEEFPARATRKMLNLLSKEEREVAMSLLGFPENSVGRLMTPDYIAVKDDLTVHEVLEHIRKYGRDTDSIHIIYVLDQDGKLVDDVRIREILLSPLDRPITELMKERFVALYGTQDQETAVEMFRKYNRTALPVVDSLGHMLGIVTIDDVLHVAEEEATEDIQKLGGVEALEEPYLRAPLQTLIRKRAGWLTVLFLGEMLTASAMAFYEDEIKQAVVLALFIPLIISSGGNTGSQAATLVIRALAIGEIKLSDWYRIMRREIISGVCLGSLLGMIGFVRIFAWQKLYNIYGEHWVPIGAAVSLSLVAVVLWGTVVGSMLPILLRRLGLDPATSSAPFVATLVDVTGLIIYFSIAHVFLGDILI